MNRQQQKRENHSTDHAPSSPEPTSGDEQTFLAQLLQQHGLSGIINRETLQKLMEKIFQLTDMATAILDLQGEILVATGWQNICTQFHRCHPQTAAFCRESDLYLARHLRAGEYVAYQCRNHLWDVVTPLYVAGVHAGNIYIGQFFYEHDEVEETIFVEQARQYGFDETLYLEAMRRVPRVSREKIKALMNYIVELTAFISQLSFTNLKLAKSVDDYRQTEDLLQKQYLFLQQLIDTIPSPLFFKNADGIYEGCNRAYEELLGCAKENIVGKSVFELYPADKAQLFRSKDEELFTHPGIQTYETSIITRNHCPLEVIFNKATFHHPDGTPAGIIGVMSDITRFKEAEDIIKFERQQLLSIFSSIDEIIYIIDPASYEILYVNDAAQKDCPCNPVGQVCYRELYGRETPCSFCTNDLLRQRSGEPYRWEHHDPTSNRDYAITDRLIKWPDGRDVRFELAIDITEKKKAEAERNKLRDDHFQAQKMESIGRLAGGIAHDFNNMLQVILGYADFALKKTDPRAPLYSHLEQIRIAAQHSSDLTRQLLAFARKQSVCPQILDLNDTIAAMLQMLRRLIGEDIELIWHPGDQLWPIKIDPMQVDQILANLAANARDALDNGGILALATANVTVDEKYCSAHEDDFQPGDYVLLAVSDNGCGISKEDMEHLFEPFFTTKEPGQGTGLGLATVFGAIKQNHGHIYAYSEPARGTTFKIYLPRCRDAETISGDQEVPLAPPAPGTETILLVEDESAILELGKSILEQYGYTVISAATPDEAMLRASQYAGKIHLLLSDVVMPGMNGKELHDRLILLRPELKTLYMSGYTADAIAHHGVIEAGVNFLQKPFSDYTLAATVRQVLDVPSSS